MKLCVCMLVRACGEAEAGKNKKKEEERRKDPRERRLRRKEANKREITMMKEIKGKERERENARPAPCEPVKREERAPNVRQRLTFPNPKT